MNKNSRISMDIQRVMVAGLLLLGVWLIPQQAHAERVCLPSDEYASNDPHKWPSFALNDPIHAGFTSCEEPPGVLGESKTHSFGSTISGNGGPPGGPFMPVQAPAQGTVRVTYAYDVGDIRCFDTELLQLDISGGNLPPSVRVRESPTQASTGETCTQNDQVLGSFFDVFTDLSLDGGQTWEESMGPTRMAQGNIGILPPPPAMPYYCPSVRHWDKIVFSITSTAVAAAVGLPVDDPLDIKVLDNPREVAVIKTKVIEFLQGLHPGVDIDIPRKAIRIRNVEYAIECAR